MPMQPTFQKFKDGLAKKPLKRLKSKPNKTINKKSYSQKLVKSIKQRAFNSSKNAEHKAKRQLSFQSDRKKQQQRLLLPKPKFYSNYQQAAGSSIAIKESQIIEEIVSSDEDDCIVLEPIVAEIKIDDESDDETQVKPAVNTDEDDNIPSCSNFGVDTHREIQLWEKFSSDKSSFAYNLPRNDSCIIINDSYEHSNIDSSPARIVDDRKNDGLVDSRNQKSNSELDDSVIFVEEDFIPLPSDDDIKPKMKRKGEKNVGAKIEEDDVQFVQVQRLASMDTSLFTKTERRKLADYNSNTYNPNVETNAPVTHKRSIIIDGSNVAFGHGRSNIFSAEGVKYCVEYFKKMGHDVKAVIPLFRRNAFKSSNPALLDQLHKEGSIVFTPCKNLPNQQSISYDDRFILQLAYERNAAILSNDNYRDLIHENAAFKKIIENRVIGYSWCDNILILPKDPYGRFGPPLSEILRC